MTHDDGRVDVVRPSAQITGAKAYWGASHSLLIEDVYRHVRGGKPFWIDADAGLETLRIIDAVYEQSRRLGR